MKFKVILISAAAAILFSCNQKNQTQEKRVSASDTLTYTYQTVGERSDDCGNKPLDSCTVAQFNYPVFKGQEKLNDTVKSTLVYFFNSDKHPDTSLRGCAKLFLKAYAYNKQQKPQIPAFKLNSLTRVLRQDAGLITIEAGVFVYMGFGEGHNIARFINWDRINNKKLLLSDLLADGYSDQLNKMAENTFRKNENLSDTASFQPAYHFRDNKFWLTDNFLITPAGLNFYYNRYQVKQSGPINILIPYNQLKPLIKPNTVLSQFIK